MKTQDRKARLDAEAKAVAALQAKLASFIPQGWYSTECMALDIFNPSAETPVMVCMMPKQALRDAITGANRGAQMKARREAFYPVAEQLTASLKAAGFKAYKDGWTVYINS